MGTRKFLNTGTRINILGMFSSKFPFLPNSVKILFSNFAELFSFFRRFWQNFTKFRFCDNRPNISIFSKILSNKHFTFQFVKFRQNIKVSRKQIFCANLPKFNVLLVYSQKWPLSFTCWWLILPFLCNKLETYKSPFYK